MMSARVPDEIQVEEMLKIEARSLPVSPHLGTQPVKIEEDLAFTSALPDITRNQVARSLRDLTPNLHAHGTPAHRSNQGFKYSLHPSPPFLPPVLRPPASH